MCADNYYENKKEVVKLYEQFLEKHKDSKDRAATFYKTMTERRLTVLKEELFLKEGEDKKD